MALPLLLEQGRRRSRWRGSALVDDGGKRQRSLAHWSSVVCAYIRRKEEERRERRLRVMLRGSGEPAGGRRVSRKWSASALVSRKPAATSGGDGGTRYRGEIEKIAFSFWVPLVTYSSEVLTEIVVFERWFLGGGEVRGEKRKFVALLCSW